LLFLGKDNEPEKPLFLVTSYTPKYASLNHVKAV
jgi:hypothetical protein